MLQTDQAWRIKGRKDTMADQDRELKQQALQLYTMFREPSTVSLKKTEDLLRWIINRSRGAPATTGGPSTGGPPALRASLRRATLIQKE